MFRRLEIVKQSDKIPFVLFHKDVSANRYYLSISRWINFSFFHSFAFTWPFSVYFNCLGLFRNVQVSRITFLLRKSTVIVLSMRFQYTIPFYTVLFHRFRHFLRKSLCVFCSAVRRSWAVWWLSFTFVRVFVSCMNDEGKSKCFSIF